MKTNTPAVSSPSDPDKAAASADRWELYRHSFLKLIAEEARLQIVAGMLVIEEDILENAVIRLECARMAYNESRDVLGSAPSALLEPSEVDAESTRSQTRCVARVAGLLSECRGPGASASQTDIRTAERILAAAAARFRGQQRA